MNEWNIVAWEKRVSSHSVARGENGLCSKRRRRSSSASGRIRSVDRPIACFGFVWMPDATGWQHVQFHVTLKFGDIVIIAISVLTITIRQIESVLCLTKVQNFNDTAFRWLTDFSEQQDWKMLLYWDHQASLIFIDM